jgi:hypothetical protein
LLLLLLLLLPLHHVLLVPALLRPQDLLLPLVALTASSVPATLRPGS